MESEYHIRLKDLPADERPMERLREHGPEALKTSELLAIIIRTGTGQATAVQVAEQLLKKYDGNLKRIADETPQQLGEGVKGLGAVKAAQIKASFELGRRMASYFEEKFQISAPSDVARLMMSSMRDLKQEVLYVLCLDTKHNVIKRRQIFEGSLNASIIHPREVFRFAIEEAAAAILLGSQPSVRRSRSEQRGHSGDKGVNRGGKSHSNPRAGSHHHRRWNLYQLEGGGRDLTRSSWVLRVISQ